VIPLGGTCAFRGCIGGPEANSRPAWRPPSALGRSWFIALAGSPADVVLRAAAALDLDDREPAPARA